MANGGGVIEAGEGKAAEGFVDQRENGFNHGEQFSLAAQGGGVKFGGAVADAGLTGDVGAEAILKVATEVENQIGDAVALGVGAPVDVFIGKLGKDADDALLRVGKTCLVIVEEHAGDADHCV